MEDARAILSKDMAGHFTIFKLLIISFDRYYLKIDSFITSS